MFVQCAEQFWFRRKKNLKNDKTTFTLITIFFLGVRLGMAKKYVYWHLKGVAPSTADFDLEGPKVPLGKVLKIQSMFGTDETTPNKIIELGFVEGGVFKIMKSASSGSAGHSVWLNGTAIIGENTFVRVRIKSPDAGDVCHAYYAGELIDDVREVE